ncbi:MAG: AAA family ATPase [Bacteroidales bacterium]|jgi:uncharacterized protein|nr:AAA family ATPase [Bacteroidales bacterium]MDD2205245.1 AAA family ATPase [Bacteroidales bacterium]MDD3151460.1 AAA family ATPase [Bacteroidales bacterium]MDD3914405.1 AAA family ATPase [Bacteroidales bacterium]MDD4634586.1 AAA family ATPase [Bacteroidales bacterium]
MNINDLQPLVTIYHRLLSNVNLDFKRYLYYKINWNTRLVAIKGSRGVGKTTMILQRIKESFYNVDEAFYVSLDNLWFKTHSLEDLVEYFYTHGVINLFFDEVHKYPDWIAILKNIYDNYPDLNIVYTGSSMLEIDYSKTDLSRRQSVYTLNGLSFREYLEYEKVLNITSINITNLLENHVKYAIDITGKIKVLQHFDKYLQVGYYPFFKEAGDDYNMRLAEIINLVIDSDLPAVEDITFATVQKTKKLLMIIAQSVPFIPNISQLCSQLETTRDLCIKLMYTLHKAGILYLMSEKIKSYKQLIKPDKIFLNSTNLMYALSSNVNDGNLRETFFANQVGNIYSLILPKIGDFLVDEKYLFEVGGKGKTFTQIADIKHSFLAIDDIEIGNGNRIPLWMFGLLY